MKKISTLFFTLMMIVLASYSQTITTTNPLNKNAILEEYTGIHCQYCPQGHAIAHAILEANPGRAVAIAIHQGSFATPGAGEPDYRTPFGDPLAAQTNLSGYPAGTVNRHIFAGGITALNRGDWTNDCNIIMGEPSPVNVGVASSFDSITRLLTVDVELYYTANSTVPTNYINVALLQDHVFGPQTGGNAGNNYEHMHMLRYLVTGQWGDAVTTTSAGTLVTRTYTYTVPAAYNSVPCVVSNCQVAVFVSESHQEIISGDVVDAIGGTNLYIGDFTTNDSIMQLGHPYQTNEFNLLANSNIAGAEPFQLKLVSDAPAGWESSFIIDGTPYTDSTVVTLTKGTPSGIVLHVTPTNDPGFYTYTLEMRSVNNPTAPAKRIKVYVLSNVATLMVYAAGDENASSFQNVYTTALVAAGSEYNAVMPSDLFVKASHADILTNINSIFYNVAWTFPAFTDPEANAAMSFIDNGGHFFVAGQDIGWDIMSGADGSHGTPATQNLYTNYMKASWVDDGTASNNKLIANVNDSLFGTVVTSNVVDVNAGNIYPDQIAPVQNATATFYYNTGLTKIAGIRSMKSEAKVVYFGVGMEMVQSVDSRNDIIKRSWDWFGGVISGIGTAGNTSASHLGQNFPNPVVGSTTISLNEITSGMSIEIIDMTGRIISTNDLTTGMTNININTSGYSNGVYFYRLLNNGKILETKKMVK